MSRPSVFLLPLFWSSGDGQLLTSGGFAPSTVTFSPLYRLCAPFALLTLTSSLLFNLPDRTALSVALVLQRSPPRLACGDSLRLPSSLARLSAFSSHASLSPSPRCRTTTSVNRSPSRRTAGTCSPLLLRSTTTQRTPTRSSRSEVSLSLIRPSSHQTFAPQVERRRRTSTVELSR
jgi:hypothetical protein